LKINFSRGRFSLALLSMVILLSVSILAACASPTTTTTTPPTTTTTPPPTTTTTTPPPTTTTTTPIVWTPDMDCFSCHQMVPYEESLEDPTLLAYDHAQADMSCYDCHTNMEELTQKHNDVLADPDNFRYQLPLRERRATQEECFSCHMENSPHSSWEEIAAITQDYVIAGELHNPHDFHVTRTDDQVDCRFCHKMHKGSPNVENPENYCFGCHHAQTFDPCSTCH